MNPTALDSPLGKRVESSPHYDPGLLFPIARAPMREQLGIRAALPFHGVDIWNAYELSWLDARGKPCVAIGEFRVPADSPRLIESKSLKLYLNSLNQHRCESRGHVQGLLIEALSAAAQTDVSVTLRSLDEAAGVPISALAGDCIDAADIEVDHYGPPDASLLLNSSAAAEADECLVSHLLKSNCPVTGQPDWASVQIRYAGRGIDRVGLLRYLLSYRLHDDFHEQCVERIFIDIQRRCAPTSLSVQARYTRRGGLDINPWRSDTGTHNIANPRLVRQ
jgi:7-cyano-7-deazaguanine reductase